MINSLKTRAVYSAAIGAAAVAGLASGALAAPGSGDPFTLYFDEVGNASYSDNGGPLVHEGGVNLGDGYLSYLLPEAVATGDVGIAGAGEPCTGSSDCSDGLRFLLAANGAYYMQYYSDPGAGAADTGFPTNFNFGFVGATESGVENSFQDFSYFPGGNSYFGISDVPEPATWAMMLIGFAAVGYAARRRGRFAAA